ncbi:MAG: ABC transporter permease, partial [Actinomycetales bacterium]
MTTSTIPAKRKKPRQGSVLTTRSDKIVLSLMLGIPTLIVLGLIWGPALFSVGLSFTTWDGIGSLDTIEFVGFQNYTDLATIYPPFWPALWHNVVWLLV